MDFEEKIEETVKEMEEKSTEEMVTEELSEEATTDAPEVVDTFDDDGAPANPDNPANPVVPADDDDDKDDDDDDKDDDDDDDEDDDAPANPVVPVVPVVPADEEEIDDTDDGVLNNGQQGHRKFTINDMNFEVSLSEIQWALNELVNNTYSESDNDYYCVEVYEGSKSVVMCGLFSGRNYKQGYKVRNDVYSLVGDRIPVKACYLTADEEAELDRMRGNYSEISEKLQKYESEPEKMEILNSSDYANISDQAEFAELKKQENHFDLTVDELKNKADAMLLQYAKSGKLHFAEVDKEEKNEEPKRDFFAFANRGGKTSFLDGLLKSNK